uniref:Potassium channel sub K member 10 n=1 Tax=Sphaerodactylus townsendi TaxID=933632 RepID=A0ACB8G5H4_9SAUR
MKCKTVVAIFFVVVAYLISGGLVFRALEQPEESRQKIRIAEDKAKFLQRHNCVSSEELEELIQHPCIFRDSYEGTKNKIMGIFPLEF